MRQVILLLRVYLSHSLHCIFIHKNPAPRTVIRIPYMGARLRAEQENGRISANWRNVFVYVEATALSSLFSLWLIFPPLNVAALLKLDIRLGKSQRLILPLHIYTGQVIKSSTFAQQLLIIVENCCDARVSAISGVRFIYSHWWGDGGNSDGWATVELQTSNAN